MKKILFTFIALFISIYSFSQDTFFNFKIVDNNKIIWQYVYNTELSRNEIIDYFKIFGNMTIVEETEKRLIGCSSGEKIDFSKYKGTKISETIFDNSLSYKIIVDIKDKKYRITVLNISFPKDSGVMIDEWGRTGGKSSIIDNEYIKNGEIRKSFSKDGSESLDKYFLDKFKAKNINLDF